MVSPAAMPWAPRVRVPISPRRLGSAASGPRKACWEMSCSVVLASSSVDRNRSPLRSKNGPLSGWRTLRSRSSCGPSACASRSDASAARSGVSPSMTTSIRSVRCGKALSRAASFRRQGTSAAIRRAVSVLIEKRVTVVKRPSAVRTPQRPMTSHGRCVQKATIRSIMRIRWCGLGWVAAALSRIAWVGPRTPA